MKTLFLPVFFLAAFVAPMVGAVQPITGILAAYDNVSDTGEDYSTEGAGTGDFAASTTYDIRFNQGTGNNLHLTGFEIGANVFNFVFLADVINIERVDNATTEGAHHIVLYEQSTVSGSTVDLRPSYAATMEEALRSPIVNRGADNVFANQGDGNGNNNNIQRIDYIFPDGFPVYNNIDERGFLVMDRGGNDRFKIAAITELDANGNPSQFTDPVSVLETDWGDSGITLDTVVMRGFTEDGDDQQPSANVAPQSLSGVFVSWDALGLGVGDYIYGYSLAANDVTDDGAFWTEVDNADYFPTDTSPDGAFGGLDLISGGMMFFEADLDVTIGNRVWDDWNGDGIQDPNEPGLSNVLVRVYDDDENLAFVTRTDANGEWLAQGMGPGTYVVEFELPDGYQFTTQFAGNDPTVDSNADPGTGRSDPVTLASGESDLTIDAGMVRDPGDLRLIKTVDESNPNIGDEVVYTVVVTNVGEETVGAIQVTDELPPETSYAGHEASMGTYDAVSGLWDVGALLPEGSAWLTITAAVQVVTGGTSVTNIALISQMDRPDENPEDNEDHAVFVTQDADLGVTKTLSNDEVTEGARVLFSIVVSNHGPDDATGVEVLDLLPEGLTFTNAVASQGTFFPETGVWEVGALDNGASADLTLSVSVDSGTAGASITNTAAVLASSHGDSNPANNTASAVLQVLRFREALVKTVDLESAAAEDELTYTLGLRAESCLPLDYLQIVDRIPDNTSYVSSSPGSVLDGDLVTWDLGRTLPPVSGESSLDSVVYALRGNNTQDFWVYDRTDGTWSTTNAYGSSVSGGGALAFSDGNLYGLRGNNTKTFQRYNLLATPAGQWGGRAAIGSTANVDQGGSMVALGDYVYALVGNNTTEFQRYDPNADTWIARAAAPGTIGRSGAIATDGVDLYVIRGGNTDDFYRYNVADDTWTTLASAPESMGRPGAAANRGGADLAFFQGNFYVMRGEGTTTFWRYNVGADTWSQTTVDGSPLAQVPTEVSRGGALVFVALRMYALTGNGTGFYRFNIEDNTWTQLADTPAGTSWGAALQSVPAAPTSFAEISVKPYTATNDAVVTVDLKLSTCANCPALTDVTPPSLTVAGFGGADAVLLSGPTPPAQDMPSGTIRVYTYEYRIEAGTSLPQGVQFLVDDFSAGEDENNDPYAFPAAESPSVIVIPDLTLTVKVDAAYDGVITNTAVMTGEALGGQARDYVLYGPAACVQDFNGLFRIDGMGAVSDPGSTGTQGASALAWAPDVSRLYTADTNRFGYVDIYSGEFTEIGEIVLASGTEDETNLQGSVGNFVAADIHVVALAFDPDGTLYAVHRRDGDPDLLFQIDPHTGRHVEDAFGAGRDYRVISATSDRTEIVGLAFDPDGVLYAVAANTGTPGHGDLLVTIPDPDNESDTVQPVGIANALTPAGLLWDDLNENDAYDPGEELFGITGLSITPNGIIKVVTGADGSTGLENRIGRVNDDGEVDFEPEAGAGCNYQALASRDHAPFASTASALTEIPVDPNISADLAVTKTVDNAEPDIDDTIVFTVGVENLGPVDATGVEIQDLLPAGLTYVSATATVGSYDSTTGLWTIGALNNGIAAELQITATVDPDTAGVTITNTAQVASSDQPDADLSNNQDSATLVVRGADIAITKSVAPTVSYEGESVVYTLTVTNAGPSDATGVTVEDPLPAGVIYQSHHASQGSYADATGIWTVGDLDFQAQATLDVTALIGAETEGGTITNVATASVDAPLDYNLANNSATGLLSVVASPLDIEKTADPSGAVFPGDTLTYTIQIDNTSAQTQTVIEVTDNLPTGVSYVADSSVVTAPSNVVATFRDEFNLRSYSQNDGNSDWTGNWIEGGESDGPTAGLITIAFDSVRGETYSLRFSGGNRSLAREADLSDYAEAMLRFDYRRQGLGAGEFVAVEISSDGLDGPWTELDRFEGAASDAEYTSVEYDITSHIASNTVVRFVSTVGTMDSSDIVWFDDVEIEATVRTNVTTTGGTPPQLAADYTLKPGETMLISFDVTIDELNESSQMINTASVTSEQMTQPRTDSVTTEIIPTLAVISAVRSRIEDGVAVISWDVALEIDTVGYYLERWTGDDWLRISETLIESRFWEVPPITYEQTDPGAPLGTTQRYRIVELDGYGRLLTYGPYDLKIDGGEISYETWAAGIDWGEADSSPDADPDGDGLTNWQEYLAGTDPLDANSVLRVTRILPLAGGVELTWASEPGRTYAIEKAPAPNGPFMAIETAIPAAEEDAVTRYVIPVDPGAVEAAYFRVVVGKD